MKAVDISSSTSFDSGNDVRISKFKNIFVKG